MATVREDVVKLGFDVDWAELKSLQKSLDATKAAVTGDFGADAFDEIIKDSKKATEGVDQFKESVNGIKPKGVEDTNDGLQQTQKETQKATEKMKKFASQSFDKLTSGLKSVVSAMGRVGVAAGKYLARGIAAGVAGVGALVTKSVMSYADYEQLVGGVDTLFKDMSGTVQYNASKAWKTAGVSENTYMETVTSFSASLINSLKGDTAAAAKLSDMALTDMSDNANKMGSDMQTLIGTYQSLARGNFGMLDNLKLGYGGTKEEMERLLKTANELNKAQGKNTKYSIDSFADIVEAIHVIQDNMGITGTTAKEATETISGSLGAMKAAWANTMTALILGGDDFDRCIDDLIESAKTFGKNIMPAIRSALEGVGKMITELAPTLEKELPGIIKTLLPPLLKAATSLVKGLIVALPDIVKTIAGELPTILSELWSSIKVAFGDVPGLKKAETFFGTLKTWFTNNMPTIKKLAPAITALVAAFMSFKKIKSIASIFKLFGGGNGATGGAGSNNTFNAKTVATAMGGIATAIGGIGGIVAVFGALKKIDGYDEFMAGGGEALKQLCDIIADIGLVGAAFVGFVGIVGKNVSIAEAAIGIVDIAIALLGMGAIVAAFSGLATIDGYAEFMAGGGDALLQLCDIIESISLIGAAFVGFVAVVGTFSNVGTAVSGMAVIAIALGAMEAVVLAFGALAQIEGIDKFITDGGEMLTTLCNIIGNMAGELVGGALEGLSNSLPDIGKNISTFATKLAPALSIFGSAKTTGISDFASALGTLIGVLVADNVTSFFFGEIDYAQLGTDLTDFVTNASGFFDAVKGIDDAAFGKMTSLFNALSGVNSLPKDGGVLGFIQGEVDFGKLAAGLKSFADVSSSITSLKDIDEAAFAKMTSLFNALAGISSLPKDGGVVGWFEGEVDFDKIASGLTAFASDDVIAAIGKIQNIPDAGFTALTNLFNALAGVKALPAEGGFFDLFTGEATTGLKNIGEALPGLATNLKKFFDNIGDTKDFTAFSSFMTALSSIADIKREGGAFDWLAGNASTALAAFGETLPTLGEKVASFMKKVGNDVDYTKISGLLDALSGYNFENIDLGVGALYSIASALGEFSTDNVKSFFTNVQSTDTTKLDDLFNFFNDLSGVQSTTGFTNVANGLKTLNSNMKTFKGHVNGLDATKMGAFTGFITSIGDVGETVTGLETTMSTSLANIVTTADTKLAELKGAFSDKLGAIVVMMNTTATTMYSSGQAIMEGVNRGMNSKRGALIATARSLAAAIQNAFNVKLDINSPSREGFKSGVFVGEGIDLGMQSKIPDLQATASRMGSASLPFASRYSPDSDASTVTNNHTSSEYTTISPIFNLNVSGTQDDRATARKVKRWVNDAVSEIFESMERKCHA